MPRFVAEEEIKDDSLQPLDLQFNVKKRIAVALEHVAQPGQLGSLLRECAGNIIAGELRIVADHRLFVLGKAHVKFKAIAAVSQGSIKRGDCIFRNRLDRAGAAVTEKKRTAHSLDINRGESNAANQSRSKSRIGLPVSGDSFAFFKAS